MTFSDADRDRVIAALREQAGEGRLDLDEFGQRLDEAYQATTVDELRHALRELPVDIAIGQPDPPPRVTASAPRPPRMPSPPRPPRPPDLARMHERHLERHEQRNTPERVAARHAAAKAAWAGHLGAYLSVNAMLIVIWLMAGGGYFWPMWPMMGWGIGLASHGFAHAAGTKARHHKLER